MTFDPHRIVNIGGREVYQRYIGNDTTLRDSGDPSKWEIVALDQDAQVTSIRVSESLHVGVSEHGAVLIGDGRRMTSYPIDQIEDLEAVLGDVLKEARVRAAQASIPA